MAGERQFPTELPATVVMNSPCSLPLAAAGTAPVQPMEAQEAVTCSASQRTLLRAGPPSWAVALRFYFF